MKLKSRLTTVLFLLITPLLLYGQSVNIPLNDDYYHWIDRYEIKSGEINPYFHSAWRAYERKDVVHFLDSMSVDFINSKQDKFNIEYLRNDSWEWSDQANNDSKKAFLKHFYKKKSDLYSIQTSDLDLHVNPVIQLSAGTESGSDVNTFINTRGVELRGIVDGKVGFYSFLGENQMVNPLYIREFRTDNLTVPQEGFWKDFEENGVDFFTARGYISVDASKSINVQFGHDRFAIGNGYRSMILSGFSPAYLFLKLNTKVWKLNYTNLFTQMVADVEGSPNGLTGSTRYPNKYMSLHHLSLNISKKLNIGVFESVIFSNSDSLSNNTFQLEYLNPIIFYRAIEQQNGSPDNVLLGADFKWLPAKRLIIYGQWVFDEFLLDNLREGDGWWGNKWAAQLGGEYIDAFGMNNLDLQAEFNISRPYTYSHDTPFGSYSGYRQPLAHPLGANFRELIGIVRYQPLNRLMITGKLILAEYGEDGLDQNFGRDILLPNNTREMDFNNEIGQGIGTDLTFADITLSYQWKHNFFIDLKHIYRQLDSEQPDFSRDTNFTSLVIRWNVPQRLNEF
ncbi:MAG: hypothetical protein AAF693_10740 [Bacteroidota bacterium]